MDQIKKRAEKSEEIISSPQDYKVCEGCGSILRQQTIICPVCKAYRFESSPEEVIKQAKILGSREATTVTEEDWEG